VGVNREALTSGYAILSSESDGARDIWYKHISGYTRQFYWRSTLDRILPIFVIQSMSLLIPKIKTKIRTKEILIICAKSDRFSRLMHESFLALLAKSRPKLLILAGESFHFMHELTNGGQVIQVTCTGGTRPNLGSV
jgi:hypothetical protein